MSCSKSDEKILCKELQNALNEPVTKSNSRKAYRKFALKHHPDKLPKNMPSREKKKMETKFKKISNLYEDCTTKSNYTGIPLCSSKSNVNTPPKKPKKEKKINAMCIRRTSNWATIKKYNRFESVKFDKEQTLKDISKCSPKLESLLNNIKKLDAADLKNEGKVFKHVIYSDVKQMGHGIKIIASGLESVGFDACIKKDKSKIVVNPSDKKFGGYGMMISTTLFSTNVPQASKKKMLEMFNKRPENVHGSSVRIMLVDNGYKEGIDLFDVKYMHIFEPQTTKADFRQAMGRATRLCGQNGLKFVPNKGWKLDVFTYHLTHKFENAKNIDLHDVFMQHSGLDLENIKIQEELEKIAIESAVDHDLNHNVNKFVNEDTGSSVNMKDVLRIKGGASNKYTSLASKIDCNSNLKFKKIGARTTKNLPFSLTHMEIIYNTFPKGKMPKLLVGYKNKTSIEKRQFFADLLETNKEFCQRMVDFIRDTRFSNLHKKNIFTSHDFKIINNFYNNKNKSTKTNSKTETALVLYKPKNTSTKNTTTNRMAPNKSDFDYESRRSESFEEFRKRINREFSAFKYDKVQVKNMCDLPQQDSDRIVKFTPSQNFISHYFVPKNNEKGLLVWHSVGTGKTCTAIATKSKTWENQGYTILWVTRSTLRGDIWKNMFEKVCDYKIREKISNGDKVPVDLFKKPIGEIRKYLNINFMEPVSFKQFSNASKKINEKGDPGKTKNLFSELLKRNGKVDPLRKTLIIIDEAHKLLSKDLVGQEKPDFDSIQKAIFNSYSVSGKQSCRVLMMTATPFLDEPRSFFKTMNLIIGDPNKRFPVELSDFKKKYNITNDLEFTKQGIQKLQSTFQGKISYLDRRFDPTQFTQPVFTKIASKLSVSDRDISEIKKECAEKRQTHEKECQEIKENNIKLETEKLENSNEIDKLELEEKINEYENEIKKIQKELDTYAKEFEQELKSTSETKKSVRQKWNSKIKQLKEKFKTVSKSRKELVKEHTKMKKKHDKNKNKIVKEEEKKFKKCIGSAKKDEKKCLREGKKILKEENLKYQETVMKDKCNLPL
tara:strand:+ start:3118 stop:6294 length:3177 start_codon:yes stop_codon:yes gene_type:complete